MGEKNGIVIRKGQEIKIAEIPSLVQRQTDEIKSLKYKVDVAVTKAEQATKRAKETSEMSTGFGKKKAAIEDLQKTAVEFAEAQSVLAEAQSLSFQYQELLGNITKGLFGLGIANIAANRSVVQQLKLELEGAPSEKLDDLAKKEIQGVINQLQAQQDMMIKQEKLQQDINQISETLNQYGFSVLETAKDVDEIVRTAEERKIEQAQRDEAQDQRMQAGEEKDTEQDLRLEAGDAKDAEQDQRLEAGDAKDAEQDQRLAAGDAKDAEQDEAIAEQAAKDKEHDARLDRHEEKVREHDEKIKQIQVADKKQDELFEQQAAKDREHDQKLEELQAGDKKQDELLRQQAQKDIEHDKLFKQFAEKFEKQQEEISELQNIIANKADKSWIPITSLIVGGVALISTILQFLL